MLQHAANTLASNRFRIAVALLGLLWCSGPAQAQVRLVPLKGVIRAVGAPAGAAGQPATAAAKEEKDEKENDQLKDRDPTAEGNFSVHEWSVWLADPAVEHVNEKNRFGSSLPSGAESTRGSAPAATANEMHGVRHTRVMVNGGVVVTSSSAATKSASTKSAPRGIGPLGVITFQGQPADEVEVDLRLAGGRFLGHWPTAESKSSRVRWGELKLQPRAPQTAAAGTTSPLVAAAQKLETLDIQKSKRTTPLLAYDCELGVGAQIKITGGPDVFQVTNEAPQAFEDVLVVLPVEKGVRIGWLDHLPAGRPAATPAQSAPATNKPAATTESGPTSSNNVGPATPDQPAKADPEVTAAVAVPKAAVDAKAVKAEDDPFAEAGGGIAVEAKPAAAAPVTATSTPVTSTTAEIKLGPVLAPASPEFEEQATKPLIARLTKAGLTAGEAELLVATYRPALLDVDSMKLAARVPQDVIEQRLPLAVYPDPTRTVRVALMVVDNIDPKIKGEVAQLIVKLGDARWTEREAAQRRLAELGPLAIPELKQVLRAKDPEIVLRVERLLLDQNQSIEPPQAEKAAEAAGGLLQGLFNLLK